MASAAGGYNRVVVMGFRLASGASPPSAESDRGGRPSVPRPIVAWWICGALLGASASPAVEPLELELVVRGLDRPLGLVDAGDGSGRLFVLEQAGRVLILDGGELRATPFLDLTGRVSCCGERGLLGLAFHPDYDRTGELFVAYTDTRGDSVVSRFAVSQDPNRADAGSELEVLTVAQPFANHNGGHLAFGPDGFLYVGLGDGGGGGDPQNNAQQLDTLLGKILRLDVGGRPFAVPPDNPFAGSAGARPEIWAYGLRNPWRFTFDRRTGDLWIGDVGQDRREEIDFQPASSGGGENYGWRRLEGSLCFEPPAGCDDGSTVAPVLEYDHGQGCSVTGGFRYRGPSAPGLIGIYLFGDFCSGRIWGASRSGDGGWSAVELADTNLSIASFGEDARGEVYVVDLGGAVYRVTSRLVLADGFESGDTSAWDRSRGDLAVVSPGLRGSDHALEVALDGDSRRSFLQTRRVRGATSLTVRFALDLRAADLGGATLELLHWKGRGRRRPVSLALEQAGDRYRAVLTVQEPGRPPEPVGRFTLRRRQPVTLELRWQRASAPGAADGRVQLVQGRRVRLERLDLENPGELVRLLRLGLPAGSAPAAAGTFLVDDVLISR